MTSATRQELDALEAVITEAERRVAEHDKRTAVALMKGQDTDNLEDVAQHMRSALNRLRMQRQRLTPKASESSGTKVA